MQQNLPLPLLAYYIPTLFNARFPGNMNLIFKVGGRLTS